MVLQHRRLWATAFALVATGGAAISAPAPPDGTHRVAFAPHLSGGYSCGNAGPYTPDRACRLHIDGFAVIDCKVAADRTLNGCVAISDQPQDPGFRDAALLMAQRHLLKAAETPDTPDVKWRLYVPFDVPRR